MSTQTPYDEALDAAVDPSWRMSLLKMQEGYLRALADMDTTIAYNRSEAYLQALNNHRAEIDACAKDGPVDDLLGSAWQALDALRALTERETVETRELFFSIETVSQVLGRYTR